MASAGVATPSRSFSSQTSSSTQASSLPYLGATTRPRHEDGVAGAVLSPHLQLQPAEETGVAHPVGDQPDESGLHPASVHEYFLVPGFARVGRVEVDRVPVLGTAGLEVQAASCLSSSVELRQLIAD